MTRFIPRGVAYTILLTLFVSALNTAKVHAGAPVWKVSNGGKVLFIGGTIHLLSKHDYPLPEAFTVAFNASQELVFETDLDGAHSPATQAKFMSVIMYQDGRTIESQLRTETYLALTSFLSSRNLTASTFERLTPAGISLTLSVFELMRLGITGNHGVETHLSAKAKTFEKSLNWLESIDQQVSFIDKMNQLDSDQLIMSTLQDADELKNEWPKLLAAWRTGDINTLESLTITKMLNEWPKLYQFILADRNRAWVPEIEKMLGTPIVEFVLVGILHLAGKDSVLTQLKAAGYNVEQLD